MRQFLPRNPAGPLDLRFEPQRFAHRHDVRRVGALTHDRESPRGLEIAQRRQQMLQTLFVTYAAHEEDAKRGRIGLSHSSGGVKTFGVDAVFGNIHGITCRFEIALQGFNQHAVVFNE